MERDLNLHVGAAEPLRRPPGRKQGRGRKGGCGCRD